MKRKLACECSNALTIHKIINTINKKLFETEKSLVFV